MTNSSVLARHAARDSDSFFRNVCCVCDLVLAILDIAFATCHTYGIVINPNKYVSYRTVQSVGPTVFDLTQERKFPT